MIYSGGEDVDILAAGASKGKGLEFLLRQVRSNACHPPWLRALSPESTIVSAQRLLRLTAAGAS